ncbi:septal ring lytic transglycosylase RlpA family protein [Nocardiopsis algeriensis]|uniref:Probable endolytic peptidoglycan transglycosylase RlpA n=1 Tax=Nocardiopsis algeriensis TaxID=1478215 RepID=A0A841IUL3_9ACTN|nr:rare lipoprotein A [Nocardiopsis algeriensis]
MATPQPRPQTDDAPAPVGARTAARRARRKRTIVLAATTGLALTVAGGATAAITLGNTPPDTTSATSAALVPEADPDPLTPADPAPADGQAHGSAQEAVSAATQTSTAAGSDIASPEPEDTDQDQSTDTAPEEPEESTGQGGTCEASYYGADFAGRTTANGETFDPGAMTAAHKTLPFGTMVQVTNPANGSSVTVRINDRGPFVAGRCLDLSTAAFDQIIGTGAGVGQVQWQVVG